MSDPSDTNGQGIVNARPPFMEETSISIAVDPVALITTECITVTSAMRKHARWAQSSVSAILGGGGPLNNGKNPRQHRHQRSKEAREKATERTRPSINESPVVDDGLASRWGLRGKKGKSIQDNPLMSAFARLRSDMRGCTNIRKFDTPSLLHPFLQVIRSSSTSATITSLAIVAITKFFAYKIIGRDSPRLPLGMQLLSAAITHCRFEASDSTADEIVLLQILQLMESMLSGPGGNMLGDDSVCEIMETGLSMCCQTRLSDLVRRSAEMSMVKMCQIIFERLNTLEPECGEDHALTHINGTPSSNPVIMEPAVNGTVIGSTSYKDTGSSSEHVETINSSRKSTDGPSRIEKSSLAGFNQPSTEHLLAGETDQGAFTKDDTLSVFDKSHSLGTGQVPGDAARVSISEIARYAEEGDDEVDSVKPYSLPSIRELFRVLVDLLQPHNGQHADTLRVMALRIIDVALEVAGPSIAKHPSLATLAKDDLCRYLFQLVRSENMSILNESLRVAGTLLSTCREVLKLQQELFLSYLVACLHPQVEIPEEPGIDPALYEGVPKTPKLVKPATSQASSGRSTPVPIKERQKLGMEGGSRKPDAREAMVESIGALSRIPSYLVELFVNYDCEVDRSDMCEDLIGLLSRNAFPDSATWSTTNVPPLSLDSLLGYVQFIADRLDDEPITKDLPTLHELRNQRARKKIIVRGAVKFNENPRSGIAFLASNKIIDNPDDPRSIAHFLKGTTRISKGVLGEFLSKKNHESILSAFLELFNFSEKRVDEALRELLNSFRLPGESQLIERIVTAFCKKYCASETPEGIADEDAVFTLTYSIIMLNTDQHNPNLRNERRMTLADFTKNLRGVNAGSDFAPDYLQEIYRSIKTNEIILPDEHNNKQAFDYAWEGLLIKAQTAGSLTLCETNIFDADMFGATWKPIVATLSYVFMSASDDAVFSRVILGFDQCAQIATKYGLTDALDHILFCLSSMSTLATDRPTNTSLNTEVQVEKQTVMLSELAVKFGRDYKAQLACTVLFRHLLPNKIHCIRDGWKHIVRIWLNLFANSLLPPSFSQANELLRLPPIPLQPPVQIIDRNQRASETGILSSFTSYLSSYAADDPPEPSEEELESTLCTVDCLSQCPMDALFGEVLKMPVEGRQVLLQTLLHLLPEQSSPLVISVKPEQPRPSAIRTNGHRLRPNSSSYDPSMVFILEIATLIATRDSQSIALMGEAVADALQSVVRDSANTHLLALSRSIYYLLFLLEATQSHSIVRAPVVLHMISKYEQNVLETAEREIVQGLSLCVRESAPLRNEITNTPDFWLILRSLHMRPSVDGQVFELVRNVVDQKPAAITADNYEAAMSLLNGFASAGSVGAAAEQKLDRKALDLHQREKVKQTKNEKVAKLPFEKEQEIVQRGQASILLIYSLTTRVPDLIDKSHLGKTEAWTTYWSPILHTLRSQCLNPCRRIRHQAFLSLQNALLSQELASYDHQEWTAVFGEVLFPLISRLLKPETYQTDPTGMSDTRVQAMRLLCNTFLQHNDLLADWEGMLQLWLKILDIMDRLMNSGQGESLEEAVPESVKNMLLVMADGGYLVPPLPGSDPSSLWVETCNRTERFLPGLVPELFPQINAASAPGRYPAATDHVTDVTVQSKSTILAVQGNEGKGNEAISKDTQLNVESQRQAEEAATS